MDRRQFVQAGAVALSVGATAMAQAAAAAVKGRSADEVARDEDFWTPIQQAYSVDSRYILLNAGGSNPCPRPVHEARQRYHDHVNTSPNIHSYRTGLPETLRSVRRRLADHLGCDSAEIALTRNTTEGISIFIASLDLKPGDEILCSSEEYHVTEAAMRLRELRDGVKIVRVALPVPARSKAEIVEAFRRGFTPRTKAVMMCQIQGVAGQIMPVKEVCAEARRRGAFTCIDGALGFGHILTNVRDMGCDYYASSLHKYLSAPLGTGVFYVRQPLIANTWPLYGVEPDVADKAVKFEYVGTRSTADLASVSAALDFWEAVGPARKQARLHYLKTYWMERVADEPKLKISVSAKPEHSCASAIIAIDGVTGAQLNKHLAEKHRVWCFGAVKTGDLDGVYVAPNLFTRLEHLDSFIAAVRQTAREGVPA